MKRAGIVALLILLCRLVPAQTINEAKRLYEEGEIEKAEAAFSKLAKRRVIDAFGYLAEIYNRQYRFEEAEKNVNEYITQLKRKRSSTEKAEALAASIRMNLRMIKGVEEVTFIDSFVVDKAEFLNAYKLSEESGKLFTYRDYFNSGREPEATVYLTELQNKVYYAATAADSTLNIYSQIKELDNWGSPKELPEQVNAGGNSNYPFVMTDGITLYYASDGPGSIGGYDIFVTRYNPGTDSYLSPENVGMPFNSPYNDYMYVIDEFNDLGWFASDRYQPEDKVCIYIFIPNAFKKTYNYEEMDEEEIASLARIASIRDTWEDEEEVEEARGRLLAALNYRPKVTVNPDFLFVIDDHRTYTTLTDFRSDKAKNLFRQYQELEKSYSELTSRLQSMRESYARGGDKEKEGLTGTILDLEKRREQLLAELSEQAIAVRNEELAD